MKRRGFRCGLARPAQGALALLACAGPALAACGGASAPSPPPVTAPDNHAMDSGSSDLDGVATSAEIGGLDERAAEQSFRDSLDGLQACVSDGVTRLEFMSGSIEFAVKIDAARRAHQVWAAQSTLGERTTEKCMFDALRAVSWPAPVGGAYGIARNSFEFEPRKGSPVPAVWDAGRVSAAVDAVSSTLGECRGESDARLLITLYVGDGGRAISGGAASDRAVDDHALDCIVAALLAVEYPPPEHSPTKVRFQL
jgi:hypothetical protein